MACCCKNLDSHKTIGPLIRIFQINVKGLIRAKSHYLLRLFIDENKDILLLQEIHTEEMKQLTTRGNSSGFPLISAINYYTYGIAIHTGEWSQIVAVINNDSTYNISTVTIKLNDLTFTNISKPPKEAWAQYHFTTHKPPCYQCGRLQQPPRGL